jgi:SAM-dependent methyltransferase
MEQCAVAMTDRALLDTQRAFDAVAAEYHRTNTSNPILREMRRRTLSAVATYGASNGRLLDLGCGPGTDHADLVRAGFAVTAIDWSPRMVDEARRRAVRSGIGVDIQHMGIQEIDRLPASAYDAVWSNFGPLNCVPNLQAAAVLIGGRLRPGGVLVASVIGRVCPWEIALYAARGQWRRMGVRFARRAVPVPLNDDTIWTRYYTPREFERPFLEAGFRRLALRALGLVVPPPYLEGFATRHPFLTTGLAWLEDRVAHWPLARMAGDHFLMVLEKR